MTANRRSREDTKRETREALIEAALLEFAEKGLGGPSLDAICSRAGYTRGAFYVHFRDRAGLVSAVMERAMTALLDAVIGTEAQPDLAGTLERYTRLAAIPLSPLPAGGTQRDRDLAAIRGVPFHQILEACHWAPGVRASFTELIGEAIRRLALSIRAAQDTGSVRDDLPDKELGTLLVLLALGLVTAVELELPLEIARTREAALRLFTS